MAYGDVKGFDTTIEGSPWWGIFVIGKITLVRSVVRNKGSVMDGVASGGGIVIETGRVKLRQSTVVDNIRSDVDLNDSRVTVICSQIGHGPPTHC